MRRLVPLVLLLLLVGCSLVREDVQLPAAPKYGSGWPAVMRITAGTSVEVLLSAGAKVAGRLDAADERGIAVRTHSDGVQRLSRDAMRRVETLSTRRDSLRNGVLWGASAGTAYALVVLSMIRAGGEGGEPPPTAWVTGPVIFGGIGAIVGGLIDAARSRPVRTLVYKGGS